MIVAPTDKQNKSFGPHAETNFSPDFSDFFAHIFVQKVRRRDQCLELLRASPAASNAVANEAACR